MSIKNWTLPKVLPYLLIVCGVIGFAMAFIIMNEKIELLADPNFKPSCDLNPVVSCGSVMQSDQASVFGFPNPILGLSGFSILAIIGAALLAGAKFKRWFWLCTQAGVIFAVGFVHWLFFQSVYRIEALCPYCMGAWIVSITSFWYVTLYNIDQKNIRLPKSPAVQPVYKWVRRHHLDILITWFLIIAALILNHFWYYYGRNF